MSAPARATQLPFDEVLVTTASGKQRLSVDQFLALPLSERVQHMIARTALFLKDGREVDRQAALAQLRALRASG